ncbi:MAG: polysaccharide biosynthesis tyrosine autokinase [Lamprobacter sp.]|uniref:GumC family protein n=1 Tax=Lamprobacter sp. TaxID=3100796 RepID=UPI002B2631FF|nr:polysaccharide biosynthesis tyrosine autokinase [Lamprobacter sp.]MEA3641100.1 polysaccharide biosynthesis tyrosine autokinase [Lamprobacter sp.]
MTPARRQTDTTQPGPSAPAPYAAAHPGNDADLIDIRELFSVLWRRRAVILGTAAFLCLLALMVLLQLTPRYTAATLLTLQTRSEAVVDIQAVMSGLSADASVIQTELDIIASRNLIGQLVDRLKLIEDPEFNPALRSESSVLQFLDPRTYLSEDWLMALGLKRSAEPMSEEERQAREKANVVDNVKSALSASNPKLSYTIKIAFESESPKKAALLANTLAEIYLNDQLEAKFEATERATDWLSNRITDLRQRVLIAERAVQAYREEHFIIESIGEGTISEQQLAELNMDLVNARTQLAEAEARYRQVRARGEASAAALGEVLQSPLIQRLGEQEAEVRRKAAEISERYGPRHPEVINVRSELRDIRSKLDEEIGKITQNVENEVLIARARVEALSNNLDQLKTESTELQQSRIELRELEREAQSSRVLLETFLSRFKETSNQEDLQKADARVISEAEVPTNPSFPNKRLMLAVALVLSMMVGLGLAFLLEALDNGYRTPEQLENMLQIKGLGMIPKLSAIKLKGQTPSQYVLKKPTSAYGEALRSVYTALAFTRAGAPKPKRLLITSSLPGEGKTTFCVSLSRLLARAGNTRVLLIEADLRRGKISSTVFGNTAASDTAAFADYLTGEVSDWRQCIQTDPDSGLAVIPTSGKIEHPQTLLQSDAMQRLLSEAAVAYDVVIVDSPPLLAVSDALVLSHYVDSTLFVVKWESTAREAVKNALSMLRKAHAPEGGAVLTQVNLKKHAYYGYGDYASYYGRYGNYYAS